jgi:hypothetical protein
MNYREEKALKKRLENVLICGERRVNRNASYFDEFVSVHPEWGHHKDVFIAHRDHELLKNKDCLVERIQLDDCFSSFHAQIVLQHYLVAMNSDEQVPMLDLAHYITNHLSHKDLYQLLWKENPGCAGAMLQNILSPIERHDMIDISYKQLHKYKLSKLLREYGPALIHLHVDSSFKYSGAYSFKKPLDQDHYHTMLLIGYRRVGMRHVFLLQNWWERKAYVEVTKSFLSKQSARVTFVKKKQECIPDKFKVNYDKIVACGTGLEVYTAKKYYEWASPPNHQTEYPNSSG